MTHDQIFAKKVCEFWRLKDKDINKNEGLLFSIGKPLIQYVSSANNISNYLTHKRLDLFNNKVYRRRFRIPHHTFLAQLALE